MEYKYLFKNMVNHKALSFLLLLVSPAFLYPASAQKIRPKPNIVLILADDMGYGDLSSYGAIGYRTENIDKLAREGMRFTNFYAGQAVCSASRAALMTGCYPNRIGITGALSPQAKTGLNPDEITLPEMLKSAGYRSAAIGKWHLGHHKEFLPLQQGFDEFLGLPYSNDMWKFDYNGTIAASGPKTSHPALALIEGNTQLKEIRNMEDQDMLTSLYTERAVDFIKQNKDRPFFLYLSHSMPHVPLAVSPAFKGKSKQGLYGDVMMEIDWSVGEVTAALKKYGLSDNTIVIFTSDNGPWLNFGNHAGSAGAMREGKGTSWEGGQRVPFIIKWPGKVPAGAVSDKIASNIDLLPSLAAISGAALPVNKIDGVNILSLFKDEKGADPRKTFYYYFYGNSLEAVRKEQWKLILPHPHITYEGVEPGQNGNKGPVGNRTTGYALYDLRSDPGERYDLQKIHPEVVDDLKKLAEEARSDLGDDIQKVKGSNVRKPGMVQ